jgi:hypothetical protein
MSNPLSASASVINSTVSMVESFWAPFLNVSGLAFVVGLWVLLYATNILKHWDQSAAECTTTTGWCYKTVDTIGDIISSVIAVTVVIFFGVLLGNGLSRYGVKPQAFTQALGVLAFFYLIYLIFVQWSDLLAGANVATFIAGSTANFGKVTKKQIVDIVERYSTGVASPSAGSVPVWILLTALLLVVARAVA